MAVMGYLQLVYRMLINVDALNMVESVGNVTRRRTIPVIVPKAPGVYVIRWVPAISGETLAHRYQVEIVELAKSRYQECRDRLDYWSEQGELLKHWDLGFYKSQCERAEECEKTRQCRVPRPKDWECELARRYTGSGQQKLGLKDIEDIERVIVGNSLVEDIGGFLVTTPGPVRRTSCIRFSYLIPTLDAMDASQLDHQMYVKGALKAESLGIKEGVQVPYYVQVGSVLYGGNIELEVKRVGCYSIADGCVEDKQCPLATRRCIAVDALRPILEGDFGAKRSRHRPHNILEMAVAVVSDKPIPLPPATLPFNSLLEELAAKLKVYKEKLGVNYTVIGFATKALGDEYREKLAEGLKKLSAEKPLSTVPEFLEKIRGALGLECRAGGV